MAQKRMFNKSVTNSDDFLELPDSSQVLYFHLSMNADDDGFINNWKSIIKMTGTKDDDLKILVAKQFVIPFESGVIVIKHWRLNNYLQKDRIKPTIYQEELKQLNTDNNNVYNLYTECIHSIDKNSIDKNSIDKNIYTFVEENFGRTLNPIEYEEISTWEDNDLTRYAIKQAVLNNAYSIKYIVAILNNWKSKGIKTVADAQKQQKKKSDIPDWFDKDIDKKEMDDKEKNEIEEVIKKYG